MRRVTGGAAIIDDTTPIPAHAIFSWRRTSQVLIAGMLLWLVPMAALTLMLGWAHPLTQMSWFFTKAALMTFGGAYAVLPYVYRGAVTHYGWLTAGQMMDGLALGSRPRTVDHGGDLCRVCRRLHQSGVGRR